MAELSSVHRYVAGGLLSLALSHAQQHQQILPTAPNPNAADEASKTPHDIPWSSEQSNLLHHVFRHLDIETKAWVGLETTAMSSDAPHHVGAFVRILTEDDEQPSGPGADESTHAALAKAVDAMDIKLHETERSTAEPSGDENEPELVQPRSESAEQQQSQKENVSASEEAGTLLDDMSLAHPSMTPSMVMERQRKIAVMYELVIACVADTPEEKAGKSVLRAGYDARHRVALRLLASWLDIAWSKVAAMEVMVAYMAIAAQKEREATAEDKEEAAEGTWRKFKRGGIIGAAALAGGVLLAITGGLAAPAIAAGLASLAPVLGPMMPLIGTSGLVAAFAAAGTTAGSVAVAASFGAAGAGLAGSKMARRTGGVSEFEFLPVGDNHQQGRLAVSILVSGIIFEEHDFTKPWSGPDGDSERYALRWESKELTAVTTAIEDWMASAFAREAMKQGAMLTVLAGVVTALAWPAAVLGAVNFIDSKWTIAVDRSDKAGQLLARVLLDGVQGNRPVTLMGFSLGARVIFSCLETLAKQGHRAVGLVERVVLMGAPVPLDDERWEPVRKVVAGRFVNCYSRNDWILGIAYRATCLTQGLAGIQEVPLAGIENVDVSEVIDGHFTYISRLGEILQGIDVDNYYPIFPSKLKLVK